MFASISGMPPQQTPESRVICGRAYGVWRRRRGDHRSFVPENAEDVGCVRMGSAMGRAVYSTARGEE